MTGLTTHVLDTMHGRPARGMHLALFAEDRLILETTTNADGRCDQPLIAAGQLARRRYRLEFGVGAYFRALGVALPEPAFLETVVIAFGISDPGVHYHVPLLVSPFAYSTYRGS